MVINNQPISSLKQNKKINYYNKLKIAFFTSNLIKSSRLSNFIFTIVPYDGSDGFLVLSTAIRSLSSFISLKLIK